MQPIFVGTTPLGPLTTFSGPASAVLGQDEEPWGEEWYTSEYGNNEYEGYDQPEEPADEGGGFDWASVLGFESSIEDLLNRVPADYLGTYKTSFERCRSQVRSPNILTKFAGFTCLQDLYQKVRSSVPPGTPIPPPPSGGKTEFPYVPVAIGAVALAGLGVLLFTRKA
jgi:hypothetical protein